MGYANGHSLTGGVTSEIEQAEKTPRTEIVHFIALEGHTETLIFEHVRTVAGHCSECANPWPCNWRRLGKQVLALLQGAG